MERIKQGGEEEWEFISEENRGGRKSGNSLVKTRNN